jgi:hypothetical protein
MPLKSRLDKMMESNAAEFRQNALVHKYYILVTLT